MPPLTETTALYAFPTVAWGKAAETVMCPVVPPSFVLEVSDLVLEVSDLVLEVSDLRLFVALALFGAKAETPETPQEVRKIAEMSNTVTRMTFDLATWMNDFGDVAV